MYLLHPMWIELHFRLRRQRNYLFVSASPAKVLQKCLVRKGEHSRREFSIDSWHNWHLVIGSTDSWEKEQQQLQGVIISNVSRNMTLELNGQIEKDRYKSLRQRSVNCISKCCLSDSIHLSFLVSNIYLEC